LKNKITTIFSPASVGKSTFIYQLILSLLETQAVNKVLCFFSDADTTNAEFQALVRKYFDRENLSESRFIPILPTYSLWRDFKKSIEDGSLVAEGVDLLIIDSLEQFFDLVGLDFHRNVGGFFGYLRRLAMQGVSIIILHHTNKTGVEISGRSVILNQSDVVYRLRRAGKFKWFGDALKHRGARELNGKVDFYAELSGEGIEFSTDMVDDRYGYVVHLIRKVLSEKGKLRQYELVREVKKQAEKSGSEVGINKIRETLAKYDGVYWRAERGERNSLEYELIVQVKVDDDKQERDRILCEIEKMITEGFIYADDMPPLYWNSRMYTIYTEIAKDVPTSVLREYLQKIKDDNAILDEISKDF